MTTKQVIVSVASVRMSVCLSVCVSVRVSVCPCKHWKNYWKEIDGTWQEYVQRWSV